jgi:hypothetical protein
VSYRLLTSNENREVIVNAVAQDRFRGTRPEVVIPLATPSEPALPSETENYAIGQKVRLVNSFSPNSIGKIEYITNKPVLLPSGLRAFSAQVKLENEESVMIPLANLEVLT